MAKKTAKKKKGKSPKELMQKHITDKNYVTSEEEFKDLEVGVNTDADNNEPLDIPDSKERPKDENKDHGLITPWDVVK